MKQTAVSVLRLIGRRFRQRRGSETIRRVAARAHLEASTISKIERGQFVAMRSYVELAAAYGMPLLEPFLAAAEEQSDLDLATALVGARRPDAGRTVEIRVSLTLEELAAFGQWLEERRRVEPAPPPNNRRS